MAAVLFLVSVSSANAVEFNVDTTADYIDKNIGDGICEAEITGLYKCTLRAAIQESNARTGLDRINLPPGMYVLTRGGPTDDTGAQGDLDILDDLDLFGTGSAATTIDGNSIDRAVHIPANPGQVIQVALRGMTIQRGYPLAESIPLMYGGGIFNAEFLTLDDVVVTLNTATSGGGIYNTGTLIAMNLTASNNSASKGGGLSVSGGETYLLDSRFTNNQASESGAGIAQTGGTLELSRVSVTGNSTTLINSYGAGVHSTGVLTAYDSTISDNRGAGHGGGFSVTNNGVAKLYGTLLTSNTAAGNGGGVFVDATLIAVNSTISANSAVQGGGIFQGTPGNNSLARTDGTNLTLAFNDAPTGANAMKIEGLFNVQNTIISNPVTGAGCSGVVDSLGYNIDSGDSCALKAVGGRSNIDPLLAALVANGGATQTHSLAANSPAINTGAATVCPSADQRSFRRNDTLCDIGAYEASSVASNSGTLKFERSSYTVNEIDRVLNVLVLRTGGSDGAVTVKYFTRTGTAKAGVDFTQTEGQLLWTDGDSTPKQISIPVINDSNKESSDELASVTIVSAVGGATLGTPYTAVISITDDDWKPGSLQFLSGNYYAAESSGTAQVTVSRVGGSDGEVSVDYATSNDTAVAGEDYANTTGRITFGNGITSVTFNVVLVSDAIYEGNERFNVALSNASNGATLGTTDRAAVTISDNRNAGQLQFSRSTDSTTEGSGVYTIVVDRVNGSDGAISADFALIPGTASPTVDFVGGTGTLSFANGETQKSFTITVLDDAVYEGNETVTFYFSSLADGATAGAPARLTLTILENEIPRPGTIQFESVSHSVAENAGAIDLIVQRTDGLDGAIAVNYMVTAGTATAGPDFVLGTGTLSFNQGQASATIRVQIQNDTLVDPGETFSITLSSPTGGATLGGVTTTTVTIGDDDTAVVQTGDNTDSGGNPNGGNSNDDGSNNGGQQVGSGALSGIQILALGLVLMLIRRFRPSFVSRLRK